MTSRYRNFLTFCRHQFGIQCTVALLKFANLKIKVFWPLLLTLKFWILRELQVSKHIYLLTIEINHELKPSAMVLGSSVCQSLNFTCVGFVYTIFGTSSRRCVQMFSQMRQQSTAVISFRDEWMNEFLNFVTLFPISGWFFLLVYFTT